MPNASVTIDTNEDEATVRLARALIVAEIATQVLTAFLMVQMMEHGDPLHLDWHLARLRKRWLSDRRKAREWRVSLGRVMYELHLIERGTHA